MRTARLSLAIVLASASTGWSQSQETLFERCRVTSTTTTTDDISIGACTSLIRSGTLSDAQLAWALHMRSLYYRSAGDYDLAIADLDQAIGLNSNDGRVFQARGFNYLLKNDGRSAVRDFDQAIRLDASDSHALHGRALAYSGLGDHQQAIADFGSAIRLSPDFDQPYRNRGREYVKIGRIGEAIADFDRYLSLQSTLESKAERANTIAWDFATGPDRDAEIALRYARVATGLEPEASNYQDTLGAALAINGRTLQAVTAYERAMDLNPEMIARYQKFLGQRGLYRGAIDGQAGEGTRRAIREFVATGCAIFDESC